METCPVCGSNDSNVQVGLAFIDVLCDHCGRYVLANEVSSTLPNEPDWPQLRERLSHALLWQSLKAKPTPPPVLSVASARLLVGWFDLDCEDLDNREERAVNALIGTLPVADCWHEPILAVVKAIGIPQAEARKFVEELVERRVVRLVRLETSALPGAQRLSPVCQWEKCDQ